MRLRLAAVIAALFAGSACYAATPLYELRLLSSFGGANSLAYSVNNSGRVVGISDYTSQLEHAASWSGGVPSDLSTNSQLSSRALGLNNSGLVVGETVGGSIIVF